MNEETWLKSNDHRAMVQYIRKQAGRRKLRLFVCLVCRHYFEDKLGDVQREALLVAERYADDLADKREVSRAERQVWKESKHRATWAIKYALHGRANVAATEILGTKVFRNYREPHPDAAWLASPPNPPLQSALDGVAPALLRESFGNPFRPVTLPRPVLAYRDEASLHMARAIYEDRAFKDLPILADLLEEGGCEEKQLLAHLRKPGPHGRGCWALDAVLGHPL